MKKLFTFSIGLVIICTHLIAQRSQEEIDRKMQETRVELEKMKTDPKYKDALKNMASMDSLLKVKPKPDLSAAKTKKKKTVAKPEKNWYLTFEVTIKGVGSEKNLNNFGDLLSWSFDRTYSGVFKLDFPNPVSGMNWGLAEITEGLRTGRKMMWIDTRGGFEGTKEKPHEHYLVPIKVKIKDIIGKTTKERGEGFSFENTTIINSWAGNDSVIVMNKASLTIDKKLNTYNVTIPLEAYPGSGDEGKLKYTRDTIINRSKAGNGDLPESEKSTLSAMIGFSSINIPNVTGLIESGMVILPHDLPLKLKEGGYEYNSKIMEPDKPLIDGVPESKKTVKVHVYYRFKQL